MSRPTGVSRRIQQALAHLQENDPEGALINLFPALDRTAKKRRPKEGVGARVRAFLEEEEALISYVAITNVLKGIRVNGVSITDALYKFGRCPIAHEGELDPRLKFNDEGTLQIGTDNWNLPTGYIWGMLLAVLIAPENTGEALDEYITLNLFGQSYNANSLWGNQALVHGILRDKMPNGASYWPMGT